MWFFLFKQIMIFQPCVQLPVWCRFKIQCLYLSNSILFLIIYNSIQLFSLIIVILFGTEHISPPPPWVRCVTCWCWYICSSVHFDLSDTAQPDPGSVSSSVSIFSPFAYPISPLTIVDLAQVIFDCDWFRTGAIWL